MTDLKFNDYDSTESLDAVVTEYIAQDKKYKLYSFFRDLFESGNEREFQYLIHCAQHNNKDFRVVLNNGISVSVNLLPDWEEITDTQRKLGREMCKGRYLPGVEDDARMCLDRFILDDTEEKNDQNEYSESFRLDHAELFLQILWNNYHTKEFTTEELRNRYSTSSIPVDDSLALLSEIKMIETVGLRRFKIEKPPNGYLMELADILREQGKQ